MTRLRRALISLSDKKGLERLARGLVLEGVEIISTGGTAATIEESGLPVTRVEEVTHSPAILGGRVKTLHPHIHGGILADLSNRKHQEELKREGIEPIGLVVVNLYPFAEKIQEEGVTIEEAIESIDIGGPTMIRAAAKNWMHVAVLTDPDDYHPLLEELKERGEVGEEMRLYLAQKAFAHTGSYDSLISRYFWEEGLGDEGFPPTLNLSFSRSRELRYGENPHQRAALYELEGARGLSLLKAVQHHGKDLSYNNINDAAAALGLVLEFQKPAAVVVKHTNPCGAATAKTLREAFKKAYLGDPISAFGGIVALNREVERDVAQELSALDTFLEVIIAPSYTPEALSLISNRWESIRVLSLPQQMMEREGLGVEVELRSLQGGGLLVQTLDKEITPPNAWRVMSEREPSQEERRDLYIAYCTAKHVLSNAITIVKDGALSGVGAGQMSRVDAMRLALAKASKGGVVGSDAFFPRVDAIEEAGEAGIKAIIQPGGSVADEEVIEEANKWGMAMVFTGRRHFKH